MFEGNAFIFIYCFYVSLNCLFRCFFPLSVTIFHKVCHCFFGLKFTRGQCRLGCYKNHSNSLTTFTEPPAFLRVFRQKE